MSYGTSVALNLPFAGAAGQVRASQVTLTGRPDLKPVADEAARRLASTLMSLTS